MIEFEFELSYFEEVENDVKIAKQWYFEQNPNNGIDERFANSVIEIIQKLQKNPFIYYPRFENIRVAHPKFFPFGVHFIINEQAKQIIIVAVFHNKQDMLKLKKRVIG